MLSRKMQSLLVVATVLLATSANAVLTQYSGNITSGTQYDLYTMQLGAGDIVNATAECESPDTLDTILTVFFPGSDPSSTSNADVYNDDGGDKQCGGFRSSRVHFVAPVPGTYTFRVDGFGSSTGPYTLSIFVTAAVGAPALDQIGMALALLVLAGVALSQLRRLRV